MLHELTALSLAIAGWLRYLLGVGDDGKAIEISADPMKDELQAQLAGIEVGRPESYNGTDPPDSRQREYLSAATSARLAWRIVSRKCLFPSWQAKAQCAEHLKLIWGKRT